MSEVLGAIAGAVAIGGVVLNNRRLRACFYLWLVSNAISAALHVSAGMYSLAARDAIFFALAFEGLVRWAGSRQ